MEISPVSCGKCGAPLSIDPEAETARCEYCQADIPLPNARFPRRTKKQQERLRRASLALFFGAAGVIAAVIVGVIASSPQRGDLLRSVQADATTALRVLVGTAVVYGTARFALVHFDARVGGAAGSIREALDIAARVLVLVAVGGFAFRLVSAELARKIPRKDIDRTGVYEQMESR